MAYQVIARKWRPKNFTELVGQNHVGQTLQNALRSGRLPHALLLTGPRGTGKTSTARILAKSLRCPNAKDFIPCEVCQDCQDISSGRSFDVIELDGASNNGVDAIRELQEGVRSMPSSGKYKLYIIDEVHMLSISAFNALLKTLEEPPEHVVFVLATTEVQKIPNTILSRCQRFDFRRISVRLVADHLKQICKADKVKADDESLWIIARQGGGSMRDSQSLLDQVITFTNGDLEHSKVVAVLGLTDRGLLLDTLKALAARNSQEVLNIIERLFTSGHDPQIFAQDLIEELRHLLIVAMNPSEASRIVDLPDSEISQLAELCKELSSEDIHMLFDMSLKGHADLARSQEPRLVLEMLLLRMASTPHIESLNALIRSGGAPAPRPRPTQKVVQKTTTPAASAPAPQKAAPKAAPVSNEPLTPGADAESWFKFVQKIKSLNMTMGAQLENTSLISLEGSKLILGLPEALQFLHDQVKSPAFLAQLKNYLKTFWGQDYEVDVQLGVEATSAPASAKELGQKKAQDEQKRVRNEIEEHPLVQAAQKNLKVKIETINESAKEKS